MTSVIYARTKERRMPLIDLSYPAGTFTPEARTALADELTTVLLRAERAPDTEFSRNITWVYAKAGDAALSAS
jgi:hypothetical protein